MSGPYPGDRVADSPADSELDPSGVEPIPEPVY